MPPPNAGVWLGVPSAQFHELAERHGTPFFLYDADEINRRMERVRQALLGMVEVFYAVKANPNLTLLRILRSTADGLDISSGGELEQACLAGFDPANVSFAGPGKTTGELTAAIERGVGYISVESVRELVECVEIGRRLGSKANVVVRVNPQSVNRSFGMKMGGRGIQFGIDEEEIDAALEQISANAKSLNFQGIHIYAGSQCFDPGGVVDSVRDYFRIARLIEERSGLTCQAINLGGGFGVSHTEESRELDVQALGKQLAPVVREFRESAAVQRRIFFELGRFLTADAGVYVVKVVSSKNSRGKSFFVVDGGLHHQLAAAGSFGAMVRGNFVTRNLSRPEAPVVRCSVAGPSCNPTDLLGVDVELPQPECGDLIGILKSGSYGLTASPLLFLGHPTPAELIRHRGEIILGRRPRTILDFN